MAEQDRYGAKFGVNDRTLNSNLSSAKSKLSPSRLPDYSKSTWGLGHDGQHRLLHLASQKGVGAEQDRYDTHFGYVESKRIQSALDSIKDMFNKATGSKNTTYGSFGMGYDGKSRLENLINKKGVGAEQDRYGNYFAVDTDKVSRAADQVAGGFRGAAYELKK